MTPEGSSILYCLRNEHTWDSKYHILGFDTEGLIIALRCTLCGQLDAPLHLPVIDKYEYEKQLRITQILLEDLQTKVQRLEERLNGNQNV